jgi:Fe-S cluster assembly iron-binding protein IscA
MTSTVIVTEHTSRSVLIVMSYPRQYKVPQKSRHNCEECCHCECKTRMCPKCVACAENDYSTHPPQELRDAVALFPNATDLLLDWEGPREDPYPFSPLSPKHSGAQLGQSKRLNIMLGGDHRGYGDMSSRASDVKVILDHLDMPSLEGFDIDFKDSNHGSGYSEDFDAIRDAICKIESSRLKNVCVCASMPIGDWDLEFLDVWVSVRFPFPMSPVLTCRGGNV